jgi:hypothetical protein
MSFGTWENSLALFQTFTSHSSNGNDVNVCVGKEWHRFPSSFFLPNNNWNLKFIKSEFNGQLPAPYPVDEPGKTSLSLL